MNRTNRTSAAVLLAATLVFSACGDDDEDPTPATQPSVATDDSMVDDSMVDDSMTDDSMVDDSMVDDTMMTDTTAAP